MRLFRKIYIFLFLVVILALPSCNRIEKEAYIIDTRLRFNIEDVFDSGLSEDWHIDRYYLSNPYENPDLDYYISSSCQTNGYIYYISSGYKPMSTVCGACEVLKKDINTGDITKVYSYNEEDNRQIPVMKYTEDNLFWIVEDGDNWDLVRYDLKLGEYRILESSNTYKTKVIPNIEASDGYLFWYIINTNNKIKFFEYSIQDDKIEEIKEKSHYLYSYFDTVKCTPGFMTYLTREKGEIVINLRDLTSNELYSLNTNSDQISYAIGNKNYIVWIEEGANSTLCVYDISTKTLKSINCSNNIIRSVAINDMDILIDFSRIYMEEEGEVSRENSGIFQFDFANEVLSPVYLSDRDETIAWLDEFSGKFSINSWKNKGQELMNGRIVLTN
jgi:hypothetical protein